MRCVRPLRVLHRSTVTLLDENRLGTVLVRVNAIMKDEFDYALLGLNAPKIGRGIPVFQVVDPDLVTTEELIALGAQLNVAGVTDMFHMVGVTPEAPDLERAFGGREPAAVVELTQACLDEQRAKLCPDKIDRIDFVMLGCPHYTYQQIYRVAKLLEAQPARIPVWILTSKAVAQLVETNGMDLILKKGGAQVIPDTCVDQSKCWGYLAGRFGATDSPKCAYYMQAFGVELAVRDVEQCLLWAHKGGVEL